MQHFNSKMALLLHRLHCAIFSYFHTQIPIFHYHFSYFCLWMVGTSGTATSSKLYFCMHSKPNPQQNIIYCSPVLQKVRPSPDKFVKPTALPPPKSPSPIVGTPPSPIGMAPPSPMQTSMPDRAQSPMQVDKPKT